MPSEFRNTVTIDRCACGSPLAVRRPSLSGTGIDLSNVTDSRRSES